MVRQGVLAIFVMYVWNFKTKIYNSIKFEYATECPASLQSNFCRYQTCKERQQKIFFDLFVYLLVFFKIYLCCWYAAQKNRKQGSWKRKSPPRENRNPHLLISVTRKKNQPRTYCPLHCCQYGQKFLPFSLCTFSLTLGQKNLCSAKCWVATEENHGL